MLFHANGRRVFQHSKTIHAALATKTAEEKKQKINRLAIKANRKVCTEEKKCKAIFKDPLSSVNNTTNKKQKPNAVDDYTCTYATISKMAYNLRIDVASMPPTIAATATEGLQRLQANWLTLAD